ncbi:MAG: hypothetical protein JSR37_08845 [Verrucomicrobia bacterium]|nr:hypothetical protein [Verrucomicrobiota bacterium]MBS0637209.1 hypothetical protein [Verrucomicrobiota bacterium]
MQIHDSFVDLMAEDLAEAILDDNAKQAIDGFRGLHENLSRGIHLLISNPKFTSFFKRDVDLEFSADKPLQTSLGLTNEQMADMYEYCVGLYNEAKYSDATDVAICLCMLNPFIGGFWRLLGLSQEALSEYSRAIVSYAVALERDDDLEPAIFTARCLGSLGHRSEALDILNQALELAKDGDVPENFHKKINEVRALLA